MTTDRRDFGGISSKWRWGRVLSWKIPEFCSVFRVPFDCSAHCLQKTVLPQTNDTDGDSEGVPFASLNSEESVTWHLADIGPWMVPKSGHLTITKIENLQTDTRRKIHWLQKCYSFRSMTKNNEVIAENPLQNSGVTRHLAVLNWRSSSIDPPSSYSYYFLHRSCTLSMFSTFFASFLPVYD